LLLNLGIVGLFSYVYIDKSGKKIHTFRWGDGGKNGNFNTTYRGLGVFKTSLKCTKIYIVGSSERLFINKK